MIFNLKKQKNIEKYKKCLLLQEKYNIIAGVIKFHQDYLNVVKSNPVDYWEAIISFYEKELTKKDVSEKDKEVYKMTLEEMKMYKDEYPAYYFNETEKKSLEKKLSQEEIELCKQEVNDLLNNQKENKQM